MDEDATWYGRREVDLGPGHIMLDGNPAPLAGKGAQHPPPLFGLCLLSIVATVAHLSYC